MHRENKILELMAELATSRERTTSTAIVLHDLLKEVYILQKKVRSLEENRYNSSFYGE